MTTTVFFLYIAPRVQFRQLDYERKVSEPAYGFYAGLGRKARSDLIGIFLIPATHPQFVLQTFLRSPPRLTWKTSTGRNERTLNGFQARYPVSGLSWAPASWLPA